MAGEWTSLQKGFAFAEGTQVVGAAFGAYNAYMAGKTAALAGEFRAWQADRALADLRREQGGAIVDVNRAYYEAVERRRAKRAASGTVVGVGSNRAWDEDAAREVLRAQNAINEDYARRAWSLTLTKAGGEASASASRGWGVQQAASILAGGAGRVGSTALTYELVRLDRASRR